MSTIYKGMSLIFDDCSLLWDFMIQKKVSAAIVSQVLSSSGSWFSHDSGIMNSAQCQFLRKSLKFGYFDLTLTDSSHVLRWYLKTIFTEDNLDLK